MLCLMYMSHAFAYDGLYFFFFQAEDGIRDVAVTGVQTCALPISTDAVGAGDDVTIRRLPEDFREPDGRHDPALDQIMQRRARPDRGKLVYVADQRSEERRVGKEGRSRWSPYH